jgi:hypothetical protein
MIGQASRVPLSRPDYAGHGLANLLASIHRGLGREASGDELAGCALMPASRLREARHVVLLVVDGLGRAQLARHSPQGALAAATVGDLSSVFPSTTASAVTTCLTGDPPSRHGLTGWHVWFRGLGVVGAPLPFRIRGSDVGLGRLGVEPQALFGSRPLAARLARRAVLLHPRHLCGTPFTEAHRGGAEVRGFDGLPALFDRIAELSCEFEPSFAYAYWPELDALSHVHGSMSAVACEHLGTIDRALEDCARRLRGTGTLLLITADHGFVDTVPAERLALEDHPELAAMLTVPLCGEPRMPFCYVRDGAGPDFEACVAERLGHAASCRRSDQVIAEGFLGPGPEHPDLRFRLGTHVLFMGGNHCLTDRVAGEAQPFSQVGVHGGMSDAELRVPLAAISA